MYQGKQSWNKWAKPNGVVSLDSLMESTESCGNNEEEVS